MSHYEEIRTPAALVDLDRLESNLEHMQRYVDAHGLRLRPHIKTHKSRWLAESQVRLGAAGVTVATPIEAERVGPAAPEVLVAYPALGARAGAVARLAGERPTLIALDSVTAVRSLQAALAASGRRAIPWECLWNSTSGCAGAACRTRPRRRRSPGRAGTAPCTAASCSIPATSASAWRSRTRSSRRWRPRSRRRSSGWATTGLAPEIVSGGSTPTAFRSHEVPHQTEIRPGTYVFNDRTTAALGACDWDDCAYTVLATVVSTAVAGQAVVDAGSKALSSDPFRAEGHGGFGQLLDHPEVVVTRMSEEHGVLDLGRSDWRPAVGDRVRIIPNHVCVSVNLQPRVYGVRDGGVEREWAVEAAGWW